MNRWRSLGVLVLGSVLLLACSDGGDVGDDASERPQFSQPEGSPTAEAAAVAEDLLSNVDSAVDCGTIAADSGWPTTTQRPLFPTDCLVSAVAEGRAAVMRYTGRTGDGGALVTEYRVKPGGTVEVVKHSVDADGTVSTATEECSPPPGQWSVGVDGALVVIETNTRHC